MLTISDDEADLYEAIKAGASGLPAEGDPDRGGRRRDPLGLAGQSRISPSMASQAAHRVRRMSKRGRRAPAGAGARGSPTGRWRSSSSSPRGMNNRDIAKELFISENTVKNHIRNILEKLHLHSRMEAVVYAVREKLIEIK